MGQIWLEGFFMDKVSLPVLQRGCNECTECCKGWLEANIYGKSMHRGKPCFYLDDGCSIYDNRPQDPCVEYACAWLEEPENFPAWMKPSKSGVIVTHMTSSDDPEITYYRFTETGRKIDSSVLNWLIHWALRNQFNIFYEVDGKNHVMGTAAFRDAINKIPETEHNRL